MDHVKRQIPFPDNAFALTFDDGFENNYTVAAPIMKDLDLQATFYVTTGFIEHNTMSWTDRVEYCLEAVPRGRLNLAQLNSGELCFNSAAEKIKILDYLRGEK